jgi:hypothetical protein
MRLRGRRSDELTRVILELFVEHVRLRALDICNMLAEKYGTTRKAINSRLQRMRNENILLYMPGPKQEFTTMQLTLHGECLLTAIRKKDGDERSLVQKKLDGYIRWGQRRKNATARGSSSSDSKRSGASGTGGNNGQGVPAG